MRKAVKLTFVLFLLLMLCTTVFAEDVYINGEKIPYDDSTGYPFSEDGVVLVPLYPTFDAFGNDGIIQDNPNGTVVITKGDISVSCNTTEKCFIRNGTKINAPRGLVWKGGPLYVPTEIFSAFDADVYINGSGVIITENIENTSGIYGSAADERFRGSLYFGEKYEPRNGLYLGCFSEGDVRFGVESFDESYGRQAAAFTVRLYGDENITKYHSELEYAAQSGKIVKIELCGIAEGENYTERISEMAEYLEGSGARVMICPIADNGCLCDSDIAFDAEKYKNDFITVSDIFRSKAPSAAMVWQVCGCGFEKASELYPGDMYVNYAEADLCRNTTDIYAFLNDFTSAYSYKKPIMLKADISAGDFFDADACRKLLNYLPIGYPFVKAVFLPDFADKKELSGEFLNVIRSGASVPFYIEDPNKGVVGAPFCFRFGNGIGVPAEKVRIYSDCTTETDYVIYKLNGEQISPPVREMPYEAQPDFSKYAGETVKIEAVMYDKNNKPCARTEYTVNVGKDVSDVNAPPSKTHPAVYIMIILVSIAGIFVTVKKINDIFL